MVEKKTTFWMKFRPKGLRYFLTAVLLIADIEIALILLIETIISTSKLKKIIITIIIWPVFVTILIIGLHDK
jgi:NADH:ubiquinone oxidoreductase subunit 3 (subunit A)